MPVPGEQLSPICSHHTVHTYTRKYYNGASKCGHFKCPALKVSFFFSWVRTFRCQLLVRTDSVLFIEESLFQWVPHLGVPMYVCTHARTNALHTRAQHTPHTQTYFIQVRSHAFMRQLYNTIARFHSSVRCLLVHTLTIPVT